MLCCAGVQYVLPSAAVWQLAQQRPQDPAEALSIVREARNTGVPSAELSPAQAQEVTTCTKGTFTHKSIETSMPLPATHPCILLPADCC